MANKSYIGDIGTLIKVDAGTDLSGATQVKIVFKKPSGTINSWLLLLTDNMQSTLQNWMI